MAIFIIVLFVLLLLITRFYLIPKAADGGVNQLVEKLFTKKDWLICCVFTVAYAAFSFYHIGSFKQDPVWYGDTQWKEINVIFKKPVKVSEVKLDTCYDASSITKIYGLTGDKKTIDFAVVKIDRGTELKCGLVTLNNQESTQLIERLKLKVIQPTMIVYKFMVFDDKNTLIHNYAYYYDSDKNLDNPEGIFVAKETESQFSTYYSKMVFDEKYYALDSYHYLSKNSAINQAHPQLAILLNAIGIKVFGMNPFGWRFMPNLFGILLLPLVFVFTKQLFRNSSVATLAMLFVGVDFMHFTISRMAILESAVTFFIVASYSCVWRYFQLRNTNNRKAYVSLFYAGILIGVAASCKWSGLFILPFLIIITLFDTHKQRNIYYYLVVLFSILILPIFIYFISYLPFLLMYNLKLIHNFLELQKIAFVIHSKLAIVTNNDLLNEAATKWWSWPLEINTILIDFKVNNITAKSYSLVLMGNPILWWMSIPVFLVLAIASFKKVNKSVYFIIFAILVQFLPYMIAKREMYLYYYYSISILMFIALAYCINQLWLLKARSKFYALLATLYVLLAIITFIAYYPIYAGTVVDFAYVYNNLSWLHSWKLVIAPKLILH